MHPLHHIEDTMMRIRIVSTDHTTFGAVLAGVPAGKDAAQKHPTMRSGAHLHGREILLGQPGTGPPTDTVSSHAPATNGNQTSNGDEDNLGGQPRQRQHNHTTFLPYSPPILLCLPTLQPTSLRKCMMFVVTCIALLWLIPSSPPPQALYLGGVSALT